MYYDDITTLIDQYNETLEIKSDYRLEYIKNLVILKRLASQLSPLKDTASIDNKINSLLAIKDEEMRLKCEQCFEDMYKAEVIFKNARDKIDFLRLQIIEFQSRRRVERDIKN